MLLELGREREGELAESGTARESERGRACRRLRENARGSLRVEKRARLG